MSATKKSQRVDGEYDISFGNVLLMIQWTGVDSVGNEFDNDDDNNDDDGDDGDDDGDDEDNNESDLNVATHPF